MSGELNIKPPQTKDEWFQQKYKENPKQAICLGLLEALGASSSWSRLPSKNNTGQIVREAEKDFGRNDFSYAYDYIRSLEAIADHWENCTSELLTFLQRHEFEGDENGFPKDKKYHYSDLASMMKEVADFIHDDVPHQYQKRLLVAELEKTAKEVLCEDSTPTTTKEKE